MLATAIETSSMPDSRDLHLVIRVAFSVHPEYSKKSRKKVSTVKDRKVLQGEMMGRGQKTWFARRLPMGGGSLSLCVPEVCSLYPHTVGPHQPLDFPSPTCLSCRPQGREDPTFPASLSSNPPASRPLRFVHPWLEPSLSSCWSFTLVSQGPL